MTIPDLTEREFHILRLKADGFTNDEIAGKVVLSKDTIKWYRKRMLAKFGVSNSVEMVRMALEQHIL